MESFSGIFLRGLNKLPLTCCKSADKFDGKSRQHRWPSNSFLSWGHSGDTSSWWPSSRGGNHFTRRHSIGWCLVVWHKGYHWGEEKAAKLAWLQRSSFFESVGKKTPKIFWVRGWSTWQRHMPLHSLNVSRWKFHETSVQIPRFWDLGPYLFEGFLKDQLVPQSRIVRDASPRKPSPVLMPVQILWWLPRWMLPNHHASGDNKIDYVFGLHWVDAILPSSKIEPGREDLGPHSF